MICALPCVPLHLAHVETVTLTVAPLQQCLMMGTELLLESVIVFSSTRTAIATTNTVTQKYFEAAVNI